MNVGNAFSIAVRSGTLLSRLVTPVVLAVTVFAMPVMMAPILEFDLGSAAYADGGGGGGGGGGNGGGDKNNKPAKGDLYGDVVYLLRDEFGIPEVVNGCVRPLDANGYALALNADDTDSSGGIEADEEPALPDGAQYNACANDPAFVMSSSSASSKIELLDEDDDELEACDPISNCAPLVVEVELGRLSMLRAPPSVVDKALGDANDSIANANYVMLDWGGRLAPNGSSLDAPLVNLAMMREFMVHGHIDSFNPSTYASDNSLGHYGKVAAAAFGLGAGDDKEGTGVNSEVVMRVLESLQLGQPYFLLADGEMIEGVPTEADEAIYRGYDLFYGDQDFGHTFQYSRPDTYPGNVMYDEYVQADDTYYRHCSDVFDTVFGSEDPGIVEGLEGFALAANDARRVLLFVHDGYIKFVDSVYEVTPFESIDDVMGIEELTGLSCMP